MKFGPDRIPEDQLRDSLVSAVVHSSELRQIFETVLQHIFKPVSVMHHNISVFEK